jgi:succinate-semialdehyde dehydrogenase/glutarate-semialdehyde dehydrogenase
LFDVLLLETPQIEAVIADPRINAVSFTGSSAAGSRVAAVAASHIKPAVLELGGSDPAIILADADLERAASTTCLARTICAGQSCIAAKRVLVEEGVHDKFVAIFRERLAAIKQGDPALPETDMGPIARADLRDNLHRQVQESVKMGAKLDLGGQIPEGPGCFYPVTLLTDVTPDMPAFREETFGPVAVVTKVKDLDEALRLANQSEYGLASSIWTDAKRGESLAREIEAGQVVINGVVKTDARLPSGGIKRSGYGRELGPHGIREFTNAQQVWIGA